MPTKKIFGLIVIIAVLSVFTLFTVLTGGSFASDESTEERNENLTSVDGYLGWEKKGFFEDPDVQSIFADQYGIEVGINKKGSIEMVSEEGVSKDYLFPSNKIATELYKSRTGVSSETIFFSPIVVYSWTSLLPDLQNTGLVTSVDGVNTLNVARLVESVEEDKSWQELGGSTLQGPISISSTDPTKSSSGNLFSALVLTTMTQSIPPDLGDLSPAVEIRLQQFFQKMGLLDSSTGDIFDKFLTLGPSTYPLVVGYESQLIELINQNQTGVDKIVPLYPNPTVWAEHGFISLNEQAEILQTALLENNVLAEIAWEKYGLRKIGDQVDVSQYRPNGIAESVGTATPLPQVDVMEKITTIL